MTIIKPFCTTLAIITKTWSWNFCLTFLVDCNVIASIFIYVWYPFFIVSCSHIINPHHWQNSKHAWKLTQLGSTKGPWVHRICIGDNHSLKLHLSTCPPCIAWKRYWISFYKQWPFWRNWESNPTNVHGVLTTYPPLIKIKTRFTNINEYAWN